MRATGTRRPCYPTAWCLLQPVMVPPTFSPVPNCTTLLRLRLHLRRLLLRHLAQHLLRVRRLHRQPVQHLHLRLESRPGRVRLHILAQRRHDLYGAIGPSRTGIWRVERNHRSCDSRFVVAASLCRGAPKIAQTLNSTAARRRGYNARRGSCSCAKRRGIGLSARR